MSECSGPSTPLICLTEEGQELKRGGPGEVPNLKHALKRRKRD